MAHYRISRIFLLLLLMGTLVFTLNTQFIDIGVAVYIGDVFIKSDGSIDPPDAPIQTTNNITYTLTDSINGQITIERGNITLDGAGYIVQGSGKGNGISVTNINNVTIKNLNIKNFLTGICLDHSHGDTIYGNNITSNNCYGIWIISSSNTIIYRNNATSNLDSIVIDNSWNNTIFKNNITNSLRNGIQSLDSSNITIYNNNIKISSDAGIYLGRCLNSTIYGNNITNSGYYGLLLSDTSNCTVFKNNIENNYWGIYIDSSWNNTIFKNNIINNSHLCIQVYDSSGNVFYLNNFIGYSLHFVSSSSINTWDNGYPCGGNYWSDYTGIDKYSGPKQDKLGADVIGDTPYTINQNNIDRYPLMNPWKKTIWISPSSGPSGTKVTVIGTDFPPGNQMTITFNDMLIGHIVVSEGRRFIFTFNVPVSNAGEQLVKAQDSEGNYADTIFTVIDDTTLYIQIEVGTIHFRGEVAEFCVLTSFKGEPVNTTINEATLYYANGTLTGDLTGSIEHIATGLYRIPYEIPINAPEGTYTLLIKAEYMTNTTSSKGVSFESFLLSPTLTGWNAYLIEIKGDVAVIKTDLGNIEIKIEDLNTTLIGMENDIAVLNTMLGEIEVKIENLNATITDVRGELAVLNTTLGKIEVKVETLNATLIDVKNNVILLKTTLGTIEVKLEDLNATLIAISLNVEDLKEAFQSWTGATPSVSGYILLTLTSSELVEAPTATDSIVTLVVSGTEGTSGTTLIVIQKELLETLGATIDDIVVLIDMEQVEFEVVQHQTYYLVKIFYTHSEHAVTIHLTGGLDSDSDGVQNWEEYVTGTNPTKPDTDGDIWKDSIDPWPINSLLPNGIIATIPIVAIILVLKRKKR